MVKDKDKTEDKSELTFDKLCLMVTMASEII